MNNEPVRSPKPGDVKKCDQCGEERAAYKRMGLEGSPEPARDRERPAQPGDQYAWSCEACGFEDRVPS